MGERGGHRPPLVGGRHQYSPRVREMPVSGLCCWVVPDEAEKRSQVPQASTPPGVTWVPSWASRLVSSCRGKFLEGAGCRAPGQSLGFQPSQLLFLIPLSSSLSPSVDIWASRHTLGACLFCVSASLLPGETASVFLPGTLPTGLYSPPLPGLAHPLTSGPGPRGRLLWVPLSSSEKSYRSPITRAKNTKPETGRNVTRLLLHHEKPLGNVLSPFPVRKGVWAPGKGESILLE